MSPSPETPRATPELSAVEAAHVASPRVRKQSAFRRCIYDSLLAISLGLMYGVPTVIVFSTFIVLALGLVLGVMAMNGAIVMLTGNGILRAAHLAHYTNNASAAAIGATGGIIASILVGIPLQYKPCKDGHGDTPWLLSLCASIVTSTLTGTIGSAILLHSHVDLGPIDVLHATRAGAVGGAVFGPGMILFVPMFFAMLFGLLATVWLGMMEGLAWVSARSSETWDGRTYKAFYYCGTCGKDMGTNEEIEAI